MWPSNLIRMFMLIFFFGICNINLPFFGTIVKTGIINVEGATVKSQRDFSDMFFSKMLKFVLTTYRSKIMSVGIPDLNFPPLEPLKIKRVIFETRNPEIGEINLELRNLSVSNLSSFVINRNYMSFLDRTIIMNLSIPIISIEGFYNISGILGKTYKLIGSGPMLFELKDCKVYADMIIDLESPNHLKRFNVDFSLKSVNSNLQNLNGNKNVSKIMNQVINDILPKAFEYLKPDFLPQIRDLIAHRINSSFNQLTFEGLQNIIDQFVLTV